jgi:hypothetical protein
MTYTPTYTAEQRAARNETLKHYTVLSDDGLRILVDSMVEIAQVRGLRDIGVLTPTEWSNHWLGRIGNEPILRLLFGMLRDIQQTTDVTLCELLATDPGLMASCMAVGDLGLYYNRGS